MTIIHEGVCMPRTQQSLDHFLNAARNVRLDYVFSFKEHSSCLRPLIEALRTDIIRKSMTQTQFDQIVTDIRRKSPHDSQKYDGIISDVKRDWFAAGVMVMPGAGSAGLLHARPVGPTVTGPAPVPLGDRPVPRGWVYENFNPAVQTWTTAVAPPTPVQGALNKSEVSKINEAFARAKGGVEQARDCLIPLHRHWPNMSPLTKTQNAYVQLFGAPGDRRQHLKAVLENFRVLCEAFRIGPKVIDVRNTVYGLTCFAACFRHDLRTDNGDGSFSLSGPVEVYLGRAFLQGTPSNKSGYIQSTDNTVGTLVHEFAHGAINAVDAPPVTGTGDPSAPASHWAHSLNLDQTSPDYGASDDNSIQASTWTDDTKLARFSPPIARRNADNYGQFVTYILTQRGI